MTESHSINELIDIMRRLRAPDGCPWDREQDLHSLKQYLVEETYEVIDAIDEGSPDDHMEELGDLLLQVVFHSQIREEEGAFSFNDVAKAISRKMVNRHPHVFGDIDVEDSTEVLKNWEAIKSEEKKSAGKQSVSVLGDVPRALPALVRAEKLQSRAARHGFDWSNIQGVMDKLREEMDELQEALDGGDQAAINDELGDVLFVAANLGRHTPKPPEEILDNACRKFIRRFTAMESFMADDGVTFADLDLASMDQYWNKAKANE